MQNFIGGSFAPPLSDETLASYKAMIDALPFSQIKEALTELHACCAKWWDIPESEGAGNPHPSGRGLIMRLDSASTEALDPVIPWDDELALYSKLFDTIDPVAKPELRNMAFHLLWHGVELARGREPMTNDKL